MDSKRDRPALRKLLQMVVELGKQKAAEAKGPQKPVREVAAPEIAESAECSPRPAHDFKAPPLR